MKNQCNLWTIFFIRLLNLLTLQKGRNEVTRNLKSLGIPFEQIALATGLSAGEIAAL
jgi:hypothetical protein